MAVSGNSADCLGEFLPSPTCWVGLAGANLTAEGRVVVPLEVLACEMTAQGGSKTTRASANEHHLGAVLDRRPGSIGGRDREIRAHAERETEPIR